MKFLPTENIIYKTRLKEDEIIKRISEIIEPPKPLRINMFRKESAKPYEGKIAGRTFDIARIIRYRNSFLPRINGIIENDVQGLAIKVKMRLHILVIVFLCVWCTAVVAIFIGLLTQTSSVKTPYYTGILMAFGMLIIMYALTLIAFKYESKKSKKYLQDLFEAEMVEV